MLATVADIAWRTGMLNPHLGTEAAKETPGIVLIDEVDLHLHPRWQRRVVDDLRRVFPNIQFIVSTHSPFIIQSLEPGQLVDLNAGETGEYAGQSIEDIAEAVMGIDLPQRSERHRKMVVAAEEYYRLLDQGQSADAAEVATIKARLDELMAPFNDNPAYVALLKAKRIAAGLDSSDGNPDA
jgi:predicted ATP-binding protein involved in virulence